MPTPTFLPPMLAKLVRTLPEGPQWEYELKLDGYRLQAIKHGDKVRLYSRRGNDFTKAFPPIAASVSKIDSHSFVLDGEAVAVDPQGKPSFQMMQNRAALPRGWHLVFYAFDLLHLNGLDLKDRPLSERRELLSNLPGNSGVLISQSLPGTLTQIIAAVKQHALEGVIAKRVDSKYYPGQRSDLWLKLPLKPKQEFVIGAYRLDGKRLELILVGYFEPAGSVRHVFSQPFVKKLRTDPAGDDNLKLLVAGKVHQGLNPANRAALLKTFAPLRSDRCPFANLPTTSAGRPPRWPTARSEGVTAEEMADYIWLRPETVAEIKFADGPPAPSSATPSS